MTPDNIFLLTSGFAGLGWITIIFLSPFWKGTDNFMMGVVIAILALTYSVLNFTNFTPANLKNFTSLDGVAALFQNKYLLAACWEHFLAFDLLVALWIKRNSVKLGISHLAVLPALVFTCMLGPLGFLIYLLTRWIKTKTYFAADF